MYTLLRSAPAKQLLVCLCVYVSFCVAAVRSQTDSLEKVLPALQGREKVIVLGELTFQYA